MKKDGKCGFLDDSGNEIVAPKYDSVYQPTYDIFSGNIFLVEINGKYGYVDFNGREITPIIYDDARNFWHGTASVKLNGEHFFINPKGQRIYPDSVNSNIHLRPSLRPNLRFGYVNDWDREVIAPIYHDARHFFDGLAAVKVDDKWGFVDPTGKQVVTPQYDFAGDFSEGRASVRLDDKWGFVDTTGNVVIPIVYRQVQPFLKGRSLVEKDGFLYFIDRDGNRINTGI